MATPPMADGATRVGSQPACCMAFKNAAAFSMAVSAGAAALYPFQPSVSDRQLSNFANHASHSREGRMASWIIGFIAFARRLFGLGCNIYHTSAKCLSPDEQSAFG